MTELLSVRADMKDILEALSREGDTAQDMRMKREIGEVAYTVSKAYDKLTGILKGEVNNPSSKYDNEDEDDTEDIIYEDDILTFNGDIEDIEELEDF